VEHAHDVATTHIAGECRVVLAFEVGFSIDLARATTKLPASAREALPASRRVPADSDFAQKPLRVVIERRSITIGAWRTEAAVEATLYDFGAVSVAYTIPLSGTLDQLAALSELLYDNKELAADSRKHASELLRDLHGAVVKPGLLPMVEDYVIFHAQEYDCQAATALCTKACAPWMPPRWAHAKSWCNAIWTCATSAKSMR
jgi:hypothetical protein